MCHNAGDDSLGIDAEYQVGAVACCEAERGVSGVGVGVGCGNSIGFVAVPHAAGSGQCFSIGR